MFKKDKDKKYIILSCEFKIWKDDVEVLKSLVKKRNEKRIESKDLDIHQMVANLKILKECWKVN